MADTSKRVVRTFDATSMVAGNIIGSGIFLLSGYAAAPVTDSSWLIFAWIGGGVMAMLGALSIAELSTTFPNIGGDFLYLKKVYGTYPAFLYGWMSLMVFETGSIAILSIFGGKYLKEFFPG
ncbi:MAG: amino acid permease, partial [Candidatus Marinimicrobia bacterium]|nr:amino acid permease [Candidatus Neomarinimicrobiota bacterium]MDP6966135.1 amino acid permease [Candidatus Neomarinimicrobiota bacterium]